MTIRALSFRVLPLFLCLILPAASVRAAATTRPTLLQQVQAADLLSDLLTWYGDRANARVDNLQQFMTKENLLAGFQQEKPVAGKHLAYDQVFRGAIQFVQDGGAKYADPVLQKLPEPRLMQELNVLQAYNLQQYIGLTKQRDAADAMRAYLEKQNRFQAYLDDSSKQLRQVEQSTTRPAATRPADVAAHMDQISPAAKTATWQTPEYRRMVQQRINAASQLAGELEREEFNATSAQPAAGQLPPPQRQGNAPAQAGDPRYDPSFYYPQSGQWDHWNDNYGDVYYAPGGVYRRYDTRVNHDYDLRVEGDIDRRTNIDFDRRQNIHVDPRQNY